MRQSGLLLYVIAILTAIAMVGCDENRLDIPIDDTQTKLRWIRFDSILFETPPDQLTESCVEWKKQYGTFFTRYVENIVHVGRVNDPALGHALGVFTGDRYVRELYEDLKKSGIPDAETKNDLRDAFAHYHHYFPDKLIPEIICCFSAGNYKVAVTDSLLGIGTELYLGRNYKNYPNMQLPAYFIYSLEPKYMAADAMRGWLSSEFAPDENINDLITTCIYHGKVMYLLDAMMPDTPDSIKIGYSPDQIEWCETNEFEMWAHLVDNELLYTKDEEQIGKLIMEGPFTGGFPKESPSRAGIWLGWQIVKTFMKNNPNVTVQELAQMSDYKGILNQSKYKPKR